MTVSQQFYTQYVKDIKNLDNKIGDVQTQLRKMEEEKEEGLKCSCDNRLEILEERFKILDKDIGEKVSQLEKKLEELKKVKKCSCDVGKLLTEDKTEDSMNSKTEDSSSGGFFNRRGRPKSK